MTKTCMFLKSASNPMLTTTGGCFQELRDPKDIKKTLALLVGLPFFGASTFRGRFWVLLPIHCFEASPLPRVETATNKLAPSEARDSPTHGATGHSTGPIYGPIYGPKSWPIKWRTCWPVFLSWDLFIDLWDMNLGLMAFVWGFNVNHSATTKNAEFTHKWMALRTLSLWEWRIHPRKRARKYWNRNKGA